jgi:hypothetical protein
MVSVARSFSPAASSSPCLGVRFPKRRPPNHNQLRLLIRQQACQISTRSLRPWDPYASPAVTWAIVLIVALLLLLLFGGVGYSRR